MKFRQLNFSTLIYDTRDEMGRAAATVIAQTVQKILEKQSLVRMIFAAAPSQNEFLASFANSKLVDFGRIVAFHMDEYVGLPSSAPQCFSTYLKWHLFDQAKFHTVNYLDGNATDMEGECRRYAALLNESPIDIVCLGIGENGHIAFNDPHASDIADPKDVKLNQLDERCRMQQVHDGCFDSILEVPKTAITLTVSRLCNAKYHFCIVPSATKSEAVRDTLWGPVSNQCPASAIRTCANSTLFLDCESASLL